MAYLFVAPTGSDSNPGTQAAPMATVDHAAFLCKPGDGVVIRGGNYRPTSQRDWQAHGTAQDPVTIQPYVGESPVFDFSGCPAGQDPLLITGEYITILGGITSQNSKGRGVSVWDATGVTVTITVKDSWLAGLSAGSSTLGGCKAVTFLGGSVSGASQVNASGTAGTWQPAVFGEMVESFLVSGVNVSQCFGEGVGARQCNDGSFENCTVWDCLSTAFYLDNSGQFDVANNLIYTTFDERFYWNGGVAGAKPRPMNGVQCGREQVSPGVATTNITIGGNTILNCNQAIWLATYAKENPGGYQDCLIDLNIMAGCASGITVDPDPLNARVVVGTGNVVRNAPTAAQV